jgi:hypothetical protein
MGAYHCPLLALVEIDPLEQESGAALIWLLCLRPGGLQVGLTGFLERFANQRLQTALNAPISLDTGNPGHAQICPPISDAKIGKIFHGLLDGLK